MRIRMPVGPLRRILSQPPGQFHGTDQRSPLRFRVPTPIQRKTLPIILAGAPSFPPCLSAWAHVMWWD